DFLRRPGRTDDRHGVDRGSARSTTSQEVVMALLSESRNFREIDERLLTAGQRSEAQLADAERRGVQVVINLALHDDPRYSLADEAGCVRGLGMEYVHIPVQFNAPTAENLQAFIAAMNAHQGKVILVHCAANYRVTAFVGLYRV